MVSAHSRLPLTLCWLAFLLFPGPAIHAQAAPDSTAGAAVSEALEASERWLSAMAKPVLSPNNPSLSPSASDLVRSEIRTRRIELARLQVESEQQAVHKQELLDQFDNLQDPIQYRAKATKGNSQTFSGVVTDSVSSAPVPNVTIYFFYSLSIQIAETDASGYYSVDLFQTEDDWKVETSADDYLDYEAMVDFSDPANATYDITLTPGATVRGQITLEGAGNPLPSATVMAFDASGDLIRTALPDANGAYALKPLPAGTTYVATRSVFTDEVYAGVTCNGDACDPTVGTPIVLNAGGSVENVDLDLAAGGHTISGRSWDEATGNAISDGVVRIFDSAGQAMAWTELQGNGSYGFDVSDLLADTSSPASWYVVIEPEGDYLDETWDSLPCFGSCDATDGTPVISYPQAAVLDIDFSLETGTVLTGTLQIVSQRSTSSQDRLALYSVDVELYDGTGQRLATRYHYFAFNTDYAFRVPAGTYFLKTSSGVFDNLLWQGIVCEPSCSATDGTPIVVDGTGTVSALDFLLDSEFRIFSDDFASGNTWKWSRTVGN